MTIQRRSLLGAGAALLAAPALGQGAANVLRVIPQANLTSLDPVWTTATVTRNHGYLIYDTLFSSSAAGELRPQMLAGHTIEDDGKRWTLTLRDGLRFHDNEPVRAVDCIASVRRFCQRDPFGQALLPLVDAMTALDDRRFEIRLKRAFPYLPLALGKADACFVMPERIAATDGYTQLRETVGSGPYKFLRDEWNPGSKVAYGRNDAYQARQEPPDGLAGGKRPNIARIEWTIITDSATAANAMVTGEQDYWEYPLHDLLPMLRRTRDVQVGQRLSEGTYGVMRFNQLFPPFDNPAIRRAVALAVDQRDYLRAVAGDDPAGWGVCEGVFACGTALASTVGSEVLQTRSVERGRAALREAGYAGEKVVLMAPSDYPQINALSLVTADLLQRLGMKVELVATDWGTVVQRRASKEPSERGGWNMFHTTSSGAGVGLPPVHLYIRSNGAQAWFGWPEDAEMERLRAAWLVATDAAEGKRVADALNARAMQTLPYVPLGFYWQPSAWRRNVTGVFPAPTTALWNLGKSG